MRNIKFITVILFLSIFLAGILHSQTHPNRNKIPPNVKSQFHKEFPSSKIFSSNIKEINKALYYQIESVHNHKLIKVLYKKNGERFQLEEEIDNSALPPIVKQAIKKNMSLYKILTSKKIIGENKTEYKVTVSKGEEEYNVIISPKGKIKSKVRIYGKVDMGC